LSVSARVRPKMDLSGIEIVDFHAHLPRISNLSGYIEEGLARREFFEMPGNCHASMLKYLSRVYHCEPSIEQVDKIISKEIDRDFNSYVRSVLDRENLKLVNLDLFGRKTIERDAAFSFTPGFKPKRALKQDFPRDRYVWTYGTTNIIQPAWLKEQGAENLDDALKLINSDLDDAMKKGCRALKSLIGYYRPLEITRVDHSEAGKAYKILMDSSPSRLHPIYGTNVPVYDDPEFKSNLQTLQDFLMRHLLIYAGQHSIPFEFHMCSIMDSLPDQRNINPSQLFPILADEEIMKTNIVMLHSGYPFYQQAAVLPLQFYLTSSNVYIDLSYVCYFFSPVLRDILMNVLTITPVDRVLFGTDAFAQAEWFGYSTWTMKTVLADVLDELHQKYAWTTEECFQTADMILSKNAKKLLRI